MTMAVDRALEVLRTGGRVLCHCVAGRHRSVCECITLLACWMRTDLKKAIFSYTTFQRMSAYDREVVANILTRRGIEDWINKYNEEHPSPYDTWSGSSGVPVHSGGAQSSSVARHDNRSSGSSRVLESWCSRSSGVLESTSRRSGVQESTRDQRPSRSPVRLVARPPALPPPPARLVPRPPALPPPPRRARAESPVRAASSQSHGRRELRSPERPPVRGSSAPPPDSQRQPRLRPPRYGSLTERKVASKARPASLPQSEASGSAPVGVRLVPASEAVSETGRSGRSGVPKAVSEAVSETGHSARSGVPKAKHARKGAPPPEPPTPGVIPVDLESDDSSSYSSSSSDVERAAPGPDHPEVRDADPGSAWQCIRCQNMNAADRTTCSVPRCAAKKPMETDRNFWQQRITSDILVKPSV